MTKDWSDHSPGFRDVCRLAALIALFIMLALLWSSPAAAAATTAERPTSVTAQTDDVTVTLFRAPCQLGGVVDAVLAVSPEIAPHLNAGFAIVTRTSERRRLCYVVHDGKVFIVDEKGGQGNIPVESFK